MGDFFQDVAKVMVMTACWVTVYDTAGDPGRPRKVPGRNPGRPFKCMGDVSNIAENMLVTSQKTC